jgi:indolepyruvate ferredoxin oxidoreductase alpha subunit
MVKEGMDLSRDSQSVVALLLRPHLSHANAEILVGDNVAPKISTVRRLKEFTKDPTLFALPPYSWAQERARYESRLPSAARLVVERGLNEEFGNPSAKVGLITHGTTFNTTMRLLSLMGLADEFGELDEGLHVLQLNVINPLNDDQLEGFLAGKTHALLVEEGQPELLELAVRALIQRRGLQIRFHAHDIIPKFGELTPERLSLPLVEFLRGALPGLPAAAATNVHKLLDRKKQAAGLFPAPVPARIPTFCTGCPERPVFSQMKIKEYNTGKQEWHASDVGCYGMAGYAPFFMSDSNMGMGGGLAAASAVTALSDQPNVSVVGDGTLWHSAFNTSAANAVYNKQESTYIVLDNKWTAMTGAHENPNVGKLMTGEPMNAKMSIASTFKAMGVKQIETANPYDFRAFQRKLKKIHSDPKTSQVRVLISEAECQLQRQRRVRPEREQQIQAGRRVEIDRLGVDDEVCVGDHACMRFNGCPSLTLKEAPNTLRTAPVAAIDHTCVGCGVCGEITTAAQLCPSFFKVTRIENPGWIEKLREAISRLFVRAKAAPSAASGNP